MDGYFEEFCFCNLFSFISWLVVLLIGFESKKWGLFSFDDRERDFDPTTTFSFFSYVYKKWQMEVV